MRYYAIPLTILGALVLLSLQSVRIGRSAGNPVHFGIGLYGFSISILLLSEVSHAVFNYPYPYHALRGTIAWLSNTLAGFLLLYTCYSVTRTRLSNRILISGICVFFASYFVPSNSGDALLAFEFILLCAAPSLVFAVLMFKKKVNYMSTMPIFCLACVISNSISTGLFLDSFQFIASLILVAGAWLWSYVDLGKEPEPKSANNSSQPLAVSTGQKCTTAKKCPSVVTEWPNSEGFW